MRFYSCLYLPRCSRRLALADPGAASTYSLTESRFLPQQLLKNGVSDCEIEGISVRELWKENKDAS